MYSSAQDKARYFVNASVAVFCIVILGLLASSIFISLEGAVISPGKLVIDSYMREVQHLEGGIARDILVTEGKTVKKGDVLLRLDDKQYRAKYDAIKYNHMVNLIIRQGLQSSLDDTPFPGMESVVGEKEVDSRLYEIYRNQKTLYKENIKSLSLRLHNNEVKWKESQLSLELNNLNIRLVADEVAYLRKRISSIEVLELKNYASKYELSDLSHELQKLIGKQKALDIEVDAGKLKLEEIKLERENISNSYKSNLLEKINNIQSKLLGIEEKLVEIEDKLSRTVITAPVSGTVINLSINTLGAVVKPGEVLLNIVPENESIVIEAEVPPDKIDQIKPNALAWVHFSAFSRRATPIAEATINRISADVKHDESANTDYYLVSLNFTKNMEKILGDRRILPGMPVEVYIRTEKRTAMSYLLKPFADSLSRTFKE